MLRSPKDYNLVLPKDRLSRDVTSPLSISSARSSPMQRLKAMETLATYFKRELQFDIVPFSTEESKEQDDFVPWQGYLFHGEYFSEHETDDDLKTVLYFGACCFRERLTDAGQKFWQLAWVWFHPYFRNRGFLSRAWPSFLQEFGSFDVENPLSPAMKSFLQKHPSNSIG